jgi:hypothetical protein
MRHLLAAVLGLALLILVLRDAFETIVLPRRVNRRFRLTALFYRATWAPWRTAARRMQVRYRESTLSWYGPVSLLLLIALWAFTIVLAFGILHWAAGSALKLDNSRPNFGDDLYLSGTTFFTLGMGDVVPRVALAKVITVFEAGFGFAFLAVVIGYLPVIYQAFSRREIAISLLDARAGSPPSAGELLWRHRDDEDHDDLVRLLADWERWAAEVLESHLSYPALAYFRSQHSNQSWLAALTTMLDTSALVMVGFDGWCERQAHLTFAMARHAAVDLAQVFSARQPAHSVDRLPAGELVVLLDRLREGGMVLRDAHASDQLAELRAMYEPYVTALAEHLELPLPAWNHVDGRKDNWEGAPWKMHDSPEHPEQPHF